MTTFTPRDFNRRDFLRLTGGAAAGGALLAACGSPDTPVSPNGSPAPAKGDVTLWLSFGSKEQEGYFRTNFVDPFNAGQSDVKVTVSVKPEESLGQLTQTALAAGSGPDLVVADPAQAIAYAAAGQIIPLDAYMALYGWPSKLLPWALDTGKVKGSLYAVPSSYETMAMFFNPDVFAAKGWRVPTTKAEFEALCTDAAAQGIMPVAAGNAEWQSATGWHLTNFWNAAAGPEALYAGLTGTKPWTDAVFVDATRQMADYFKRGWFGGGVEAYFTNKFGDLYGKLADGKAALVFSGTWTMGELPEFFGDKRWDWAPLPALSDAVKPGVFPLGIGNTFAVNRAAKAPGAAAKFLDHLISGSGAQAKAITEGFAPFPVKLDEAAFPADLDPRIRRLYVDLPKSTNVGYTMWTFWPPKSNTFLGTDIDKVIAGKLSPEDFCKQLNDMFKTELAAGKVPPVVRPGGGK